MSRKKYCLFCFTQTLLALLLGATIYVFFWLEATNPAWIRFFLPDALWSYALCFALAGVWGNTVKSLILVSILDAGWGIFWETLQHFHLVPGTGDFWDVFVYIVAMLLAICVLYNLKVEE